MVTTSLRVSAAFVFITRKGELDVSLKSCFNDVNFCCVSTF